MNRLTGKVAVVTAAAQGIGRATAEAFAHEGAVVWATDINEEALAAAKDHVRLNARRLDVRDSQAVAAFFAEIGPVDILFNCAGMVQHGTVLDTGEEDLDLAFDLNVKSMLRTIQAALPGMLDRGHGAIINVASVVSSITGAPDRFAYGVTKAGVIGLTKSVARDFASRGIRCNAICPGAVESPSLQARWHAQGDFDKAKAGFIARQPIGRISTPQEVADLAVYLAGADSTTGQVHVIDGGWTI